ncbi:hypothetical protein [Paenibacillus puerhi]|uniref:hypothetical protein n=1 Tax=Paenibacillus puerhi TaxID=2692622 RepID=UPI0013584E0B|nr:hypothetical protein [Paenibacillus puerhi]
MKQGRYRRIKRLALALALVWTVSHLDAEPLSDGKAGGDVSKAWIVQTADAAQENGSTGAAQGPEEGKSAFHSVEDIGEASASAKPQTRGEPEAWLSVLIAAGFIGTVYARRVLALQRM